MSILNGDVGIKILEGFNIFLSNSRFPITPEKAHGFVDLTIQPVKNVNASGSNNVIRSLFMVETNIHPDVFQIIDESTLAKLIGSKIQEVTSVTYFGLMKVKVVNVGIASGYDTSFKIYPME